MLCLCVLQTNQQGMKLQCSHYFPLDARSADGKLPVVVYCHCNSGSRRDAEEAVYHLLPCGVGVVAFDFTVSWGIVACVGLQAIQHSAQRPAQRPAQQCVAVKAPIVRRPDSHANSQQGQQQHVLSTSKACSQVVPGSPAAAAGAQP
jgi:hypothetical protein